MTENRLEMLDLNFSDMLTKASKMQQRKAAKLACKFALERTQIQEPIVRQGLEALELGRYGDSSILAKLQSLANHLDEIQWDLQEKMESGGTDLSTYLAAFKRARAATALYFALNADALVAATESIYEAYSATDRFDVLKKAIINKLESEPEPIAL